MLIAFNNRKSHKRIIFCISNVFLDILEISGHDTYGPHTGPIWVGQKNVGAETIILEMEYSPKNNNGKGSTLFWVIYDKPKHTNSVSKVQNYFLECFYKLHMRKNVCDRPIWGPYRSGREFFVGFKRS